MDTDQAIRRGYFSRIELRDDPQALKALAGQAWGGYRLHQSLWKLFEGEINRRNFLYRAIEGREGSAFYVVSAQAPRIVDRLWRVQTKDYAPRLQQGDRFRFSLRANPVVTRTIGDKGKRHDVIMDAKKGTADRDLDPRGFWYRPGLEWLNRRAGKGGFQVEKVNIDGYRQHRMFKPGRGRQQDIRFSTLDFDGILTVTDPDALGQILFGGVGPAKAFGCGLLLVRRV